MGMYGKYVAISKEDLEAIKEDATKLYDIEAYTTLDIDKSWQAIFYTLNRDIEDGEAPMNLVVPMSMDYELGLEEMDYGSFLLTNDLIKEGYAYMQTINKEKLRDMYDLTEMVKEGIYPLSDSDLEDDENSFFEYLFENFENIKKFYKKMINEDKSLVFYIS